MVKPTGIKVKINTDDIVSYACVLARVKPTGIKVKINTDDAFPYARVLIIVKPADTKERTNADGVALAAGGCRCGVDQHAVIFQYFLTIFNNERDIVRNHCIIRWSSQI